MRGRHRMGVFAVRWYQYCRLFPFFCGIKLEKSSGYGYLIIFKRFLLFINDNETGSDYGEL